MDTFPRRKPPRQPNSRKRHSSDIQDQTSADNLSDNSHQENSRGEFDSRQGQNHRYDETIVEEVYVTRSNSQEPYKVSEEEIIYVRKNDQSVRNKTVDDFSAQSFGTGLVPRVSTYAQKLQDTYSSFAYEQEPFHQESERVVEAPENISSDQQTSLSAEDSIVESGRKLANKAGHDFRQTKDSENLSLGSEDAKKGSKKNTKRSDFDDNIIDISTRKRKNSSPAKEGKKSRKSLYLSLGIIVVLVAALMAVVVFTPALALKDIRVTGLKLIKREQIETNLASLNNKSLTQISENEVKDLLKPIVGVKDVSAQMNPLHEMVVHVKERVPVAVMKKSDQYVLVDSDGVELSSSKDKDSVQLPQIDGDTTARGDDVMKSILAVLGTLPESLLKKVDYVRASTPNSVEFVLEDKKAVVWGNSSQSKLKVKDVEALLKDKRVQKDVKTIDVSAPGTPITKN